MNSKVLVVAEELGAAYHATEEGKQTIMKKEKTATANALLQYAIATGLDLTVANLDPKTGRASTVKTKKARAKKKKG